MKQYTWTVTVDADSEADGAFPDLDSPDIATPEGEAVAVMEGEKAPAPEEGKGTETHRVVYTFSRLRGRITVSIDGDAFDLPAGFLASVPPGVRSSAWGQSRRCWPWTGVDTPA